MVSRKKLISVLEKPFKRTQVIDNLIEVTSVDVSNGVDIQGIQWHQLEETREGARLTRIGPDKEDYDDDDRDDDDSDDSGSEEEDCDDEGDDDKALAYATYSYLKEVASIDRYERQEVAEYEDRVFNEKVKIGKEEYEYDGQQEYVPVTCLDTNEDEEVKTKAEEVKTKAGERVGDRFDFFVNTRLVQPVKAHEQLTNMVWATSAQDVYVMTKRSVVSHWSSATRSLTPVTTDSGNFEPSKDYVGTLPKGFDYFVTLSTFNVNGNLLVGGGCDGELICKRLDTPGVIFSTTMTMEENSITTSIQIHDREGILVTNNDGFIRVFDMESFKIRKKIQFGCPVNTASLSPDGTKAVIGGDSCGLILADASKKVFTKLPGEDRCCRSTCWNPDGIAFAESSSDKKCRIWDIRKTSQPVHVLEMAWKEATSVRFSSDGELMVVGETDDFVSIYSTRNNYKMEQQINFFGKLAGLSLSPDDESLFIGIEDVQSYPSSLLVYHRRKGYVDTRC